jgi:hypothetical protein
VRVTFCRLNSLAELRRIGQYERVSIWLSAGDYEAIEARQ